MRVSGQMDASVVAMGLTGVQGNSLRLVPRQMSERISCLQFSKLELPQPSTSTNTCGVKWASVLLLITDHSVGNNTLPGRRVTQVMRCEQKFSNDYQSIDTQSTLIATRAIQVVVLLPELRITRMAEEHERQPKMTRTFSKNATMFFFPTSSSPTYCFLLTFVGHLSLGLFRKWGYLVWCMNFEMIMVI